MAANTIRLAALLLGNQFWNGTQVKFQNQESRGEWLSPGNQKGESTAAEGSEVSYLP